MKEFQELTINELNKKIAELQEENSRLRSKILSENDVKMIVAKAIENKFGEKQDSLNNIERRKSQSFKEPISLQIKGGKNMASQNPHFNKNTETSSNHKEEAASQANNELLEQMQKFMKTSQQHNAEIIREMK